MSSYESCEHKASAAIKSTKVATKSSTEATSATTMNKGFTDAGKTATAASKAAKATKTSPAGKAKVEKMKKIASGPFISFTTREMRVKYSALPNGSIVENVGTAQRYMCHIDDLDTIEGFRTFIHEIPYETRTTKYSHVIFVSEDETPMKQQVLGIMYFHKNLKTDYAPEAEKWLKMMRDGVRVFMTDDGFTTVDPIKKMRAAKAKVAETTAPAKEVVVEEVKKFVPAPPPKVNAWSKPLIKPIAEEPVEEEPVEESDSEESGSEDEAVETPELVQEEAPADAYDGKWQTVGKPVKKAPKYFICMERGYSLKVTYGDDGRPSILQMNPDGSSTVIGWTPDMKAHGFKHLRTPEGHHMFFKSSHLKVPLMIQCLDYTVKNSTDAVQVARAREVLSWKKKFIVKNSAGDLEWAKTYKTAASEATTGEAPLDLTSDAFPELA